ncbi:MAG: hypothetical protein ACE5F8_06355 [Woeseiaceae bacterium]
MTKKLLSVVLVTGLVCAQQLRAQDQEIDERAIREAEMAQVFKSGMAGIVDGMNRGSFDRYVMAIDQDDLFDRIFGLRLISQRLKRDWREQQEERFPEFIAGLYSNESKDGLKATLLNVESSGDRGRAVVRFDMTFFRVNYVEYELRLDHRDRLIIVDWIDYFWGHRFTEFAGLMLVSAHPLENAVRKLFDHRNVSQAELFEMTELLKTSRDLNYQRYMQIFDRLDDKVKRQRVALKVGIDITRIRMKRREQRKVLEAIAQYHPDDPLFTLALLDYYLPTQQYALAEAGLERLQDKLGIDDAMMNARLSSIALVTNRVGEAEALALKSVQQETGLELAWWSLLRAKAAMEEYDEAVRVLDRLERDFGHELGPDTLNRDADFRKLVRSAEYQSWIEAKS